MKIGFIGQGWIGKIMRMILRHAAIRWSGTRSKNPISRIKTLSRLATSYSSPYQPQPRRTVLTILSCEESPPLVGKEKIAVIKSTILPGTTEALQKLFPDIFVLHSPEFLVETSAAYDAAHPQRNIIGIPKMDARYREKAEEVLGILPDAPYAKVMSARCRICEICR